VPPLFLVLLYMSPAPLTMGQLSTGQQPERYTEELFLEPLRDGSFLAHFHFVNHAHRTKHHNLFPRAISLLAATQPVKEFELSFTHGQWHTEQWGTPHLPTRPVGAELRANFYNAGCHDCRGPRTRSNLAPMWTSLTHSLSGLFCASLNFLDNPLAAAGTLSFSVPQACGPQEGNGTWEEAQALYGALPREAVCTENLTPWLKLLPCRDADGLGALLDRPQVYSAAYHSMHTRLELHRGAGEGDAHPSLLLTQSLTLVLRPRAGSHWAADPLGGGPCELLRNLWDVPTTGPCPLASTSNIYLGLPSATDPSRRLSEVRMFRLGDPSCVWTKTADELHAGQRIPPPPPQLLAQLHVAQEDGQSGSLVTQVQLGQGKLGNCAQRKGTAASSNGTLPARAICISQLIPWYLRIHLHTLHLTVDGEGVKWQTVVDQYRVEPSRDRERPTVIELCVPVHQTCSHLTVSVRFDKAFLTVFEHPPDTARGFDVPAAMAHLRGGLQESATCSPCQAPTGTPLLGKLHETLWPQVYTQGLLLPLPCPDFSMPYNVTCFTSTLLAIYLGSILTLLLHRPRVAAMAAAAAQKKSMVGKAARVLSLLVVFGGLMLYLDKDVQRTAGMALGIDIELLLSQ